MTSEVKELNNEEIRQNVRNFVDANLANLIEYVNDPERLTRGELIILDDNSPDVVLGIKDAMFAGDQPGYELTLGWLNGVVGQVPRKRFVHQHMIGDMIGRWTCVFKTPFLSHYLYLGMQATQKVQADAEEAEIAEFEKNYEEIQTFSDDDGRFPHIEKIVTFDKDFGKDIPIIWTKKDVQGNAFVETSRVSYPEGTVLIGFIVQDIKLMTMPDNFKLEPVTNQPFTSSKEKSIFSCDVKLRNTHIMTVTDANVTVTANNLTGDYDISVTGPAAEFISHVSIRWVIGVKKNVEQTAG